MKFGRNDPWVTGTDIGGQFGSRSKFKVKGQIFKSASIWMKFGRNDPWVTGFSSQGGNGDQKGGHNHKCSEYPETHKNRIKITRGCTPNCHWGQSEKCSQVPHRSLRDFRRCRLSSTLCLFDFDLVSKMS